MAKILLIGGNSGIGLASARKLKADGHEVIAAARGKDQLESLGIPCQDFDATAVSKLTLPEQLDGLAYFPGTINLKPFARLDKDAFLNDLQINTLAAVEVIQQALPSFKKSSAASVVLFSTVAVQLGMPFHSSIAVSKGAIEGLTRALAAELAPTVRVNAIAPSLTDTPLASSLISSEDKRTNAENRHPLKRLASAEELANLTAYLLGSESAPLTGQILHPDNGLSSVKLF
ncbi:SDR family NAD(P)-dependent oxidoreductase [Roseibacillus persicicus]|uniref:SDR family NAD(P)-dependent oxidoreductase n=1 Tax=Roseibacillus persicicus TaxID=454148 RepID=UPI00280F75F5|nr:SDR family oxidoreductase [Roseibacillus persicicus]MDQ8188719.1 SDR family NAD(P)-dependent oxidoreductase [Roseibacillus persicicus]